MKPRVSMFAGIRLLMLLLSAALLTSCSGRQSSLDPAGPDAGRISNLLWLMVVISTVVFLLVLAALAYSLVQARRRNQVTNAPEAARKMTRSISVAVAATVVTLFVLLVTSVYTGRALTSKSEQDALKISIIGHQWWWEIQYDADTPSRMLKTANELHVPVGRVVKLKLTSHDVIHSFWAPNFTGKRDLIPGHETTAFFEPNRTGLFRGQCAEFCGHQHALMAFDVIAQTAEEFSDWYEQQLQSPPTPSEATAMRGQQIFMTSRCVMCHAIAGTAASATAGPDLTHVASRRTIGAGTLLNTPAHLENWVKDSQSIKPGNKMPRIELSDDDLKAVVAYLETLN